MFGSRCPKSQRRLRRPGGAFDGSGDSVLQCGWGDGGVHRQKFLHLRIGAAKVHEKGGAAFALRQMLLSARRKFGEIAVW